MSSPVQSFHRPASTYPARMRKDDPFLRHDQRGAVKGFCAFQAAWLDNLLFWGSKEEVRSTVAEFKSLCNNARVELKPSEEARAVHHGGGFRQSSRVEPRILRYKDRPPCRNGLRPPSGS
eukprot:PhM_4_TR16120/c0_g4_i6/m.32136